MEAFAPQIERMMKCLFASLNEADRRRYAAIQVFWDAIQRLSSEGLRNWKAKTCWIRSAFEKKGGHKTLIEQELAIEANFCKVLEDHTE